MLCNDAHDDTANVLAHTHSHAAEGKDIVLPVFAPPGKWESSPWLRVAEQLASSSRGDAKTCPRITPMHVWFHERTRTATPLSSPPMPAHPSPGEKE